MKSIGLKEAQKETWLFVGQGPVSRELSTDIPIQIEISVKSVLLHSLHISFWELGY